jgi:four helix bundle protein
VIGIGAGFCDRFRFLLTDPDIVTPVTDTETGHSCRSQSADHRYRARSQVPRPITATETDHRSLACACLFAHFSCQRPTDYVDSRLDVVTKNCALWGMHKPMSSDIFEHFISIVELSRPVVAVVSRKDRDLGSQLRRAISSIGLNIGEGFGVAGGNGRLRFETALGSLRETVAALRIAVAWGYLAPGAVTQLIESLQSLGGRVFGLARR